MLCVADPAGVLFPTTAPCTTVSKPRGLDVSNCGSAPLTITSIQVIGPAAGDFSITQNCTGAVFAPGAICRINIAFTPTAPGPRVAYLEIITGTAGGTVLVPLTGTATPLGGITSTILVTFPDQAIGTTSAPQSFTLTNTTGQPLTISNANLVGANPGSFSIVGAPITLAPGETRTIQVVFTPTVPGTQTASLLVSSTTACGPSLTQILFIGNTPRAELKAAVRVTSLAFCPQLVGTTSASQTASFTNLGSAPLSIEVHLEGPNSGDFHILSGGSPGTLAPGETRSIVVSFSPTAPGTRTAILTIVSNDPDSPHQVPLTGIGTTSASSFAPTSLTFAGQALGTTSGTQTITFTNPASTPLDVNVVLDGANKNDFIIVSGGGPATIPGGGTRTITIAFQPTGTGTRTATLNVTSNAGACVQSAAISGTGLSCVPVTINFLRNETLCGRVFFAPLTSGVPASPILGPGDLTSPGAGVSLNTWYRYSGPIPEFPELGSGTWAVFISQPLLPAGSFSCSFENQVGVFGLGGCPGQYTYRFLFLVPFTGPGTATNFTVGNVRVDAVPGSIVTPPSGTTFGPGATATATGQFCLPPLATGDLLVDIAFTDNCGQQLLYTLTPLSGGGPAPAD
jgi:hypothetical protein